MEQVERMLGHSIWLSHAGQGQMRIEQGDTLHEYNVYGSCLTLSPVLPAHPSIQRHRHPQAPLKLSQGLMVVPGKIRWTDSKPRKKRPRRDPASQRNAAQLKLEADEAFNTLAQFLPQGGLPRHNRRSPSPGIQGFEYDPNAGNPADHSEDEDELQPDRLAQYLRSRKYRQKRARNAELWNSVIPRMFVEYMRLRPKTMVWGHPDLWNRDWHTCECPPGQVRIRNIDMVDLLSIVVSLPFHPMFSNQSGSPHS